MDLDSDFVLDRCAAVAALEGDLGDTIDPSWRQRLRAVVAGRVVPGLAARCGARVPDPPATSLHDHAVSLAAAAATAPVATSIGLVERWLGEEVGLEAVFLHVLGPAARHLGDLWIADRLSFIDVTRGLGVLQALLRRYAPAFERHAEPHSLERSILLAPVPGEQHTFGLSVLAAFFRRAGWHVALEPNPSTEGLLARVEQQPFSVIGLSVASTRSLGRMPALTAALRASPGGEGASILAGGAAFFDGAVGNPGVDAIACDAVAALAVAETRVRSMRTLAA